MLWPVPGAAWGQGPATQITPPLLPGWPGCNVPILCNDIPANDLNLPSETYTTDFVLHYDDGHTAIREAVFRSYLSRPSVAEKLELSRRYWQQQGISDWGIIIDKEDTNHEES